MSWDKDISDATKQLAALDRVIQASLPRAAQAGAGEFQAEAKRLTPLLDGDLKKSITNQVGTTRKPDTAVHEVFTLSDYALKTEYGRHKQPFFRPAIKSANARMLAAIKTAVKRETDKVL